MLRSAGRAFFIFIVALIVAAVIAPLVVGEGSGLPRDLSSAFAPAPILIAMLAAFLDWRDQRSRQTSDARTNTAQSAKNTQGSNPLATAALGGVGWSIASITAGLSRIANGFAALARGFGTYRTGRKNGDHTKSRGLDWAVLAALLLIGLLFLVLGIANNSKPAILISALTLGAAATIGYDREFTKVLRLAAIPSPRYLVLWLSAAFVIGQLIVGFSATLRPAYHSNPTPMLLVGDMIARIFYLIASLLPSLPLFAALAQTSPAPGTTRPVWPVVAGLVGASIIMLVGTLVWDAVFAPVFKPYYTWHELAFSSTYMFAFGGMVAGIGASGWRQSFGPKVDRAFDWSGLFPASIKASLIGVVLAMTLCSTVLFQSGPRLGSFSIAAGAVSLIAVGFAWLLALQKIMALESSHFLRTIAAWIALIALFPISFGLAQIIVDAREWGPILIFLCAPVTLAVCVLVAMIVPQALARITLGSGLIDHNQ